VSWQPKLGELVVYNYPDSRDIVGRVVGHVAERDGMPHRIGQPIVRWPADPPGGIFRRTEPYLGVTHPMFLWPAWFGRLVDRCGGDFGKAQRRARRWGLPA